MRWWVVLVDDATGNTFGHTMAGIYMEREAWASAARWVAETGSGLRVQSVTRIPDA